MTGFPPEGSNRDLEYALRRALQHSAPASDYDDLVHRVHHRVGVKRRRRAIGTAVAGVAAAGVIATGGVLVLGELNSPELLPAAHYTDGEPSPTGAPWQPSEPPEPANGIYGDGNAWEIPDPRPTGISDLDAMGAPAAFVTTPGVSSLPGIIECGSGWEAGEGLPVAGMNVLYSDESSDLSEIRIAISGWDEDATLDQFRDEAFPCTWVGDEINETEWTGQGEALLTQLYSTSTGQTFVGVLIPVGQYTVGVTVEGEDTVLTTEVASEVAVKTVENLRALDPERAGS